MESSVDLTYVWDKELVQEKISSHKRKGWIPVISFQNNGWGGFNGWDGGWRVQEPTCFSWTAEVLVILFLSAEVRTMSACISFYFNHGFSQSWFWYRGLPNEESKSKRDRVERARDPGQEEEEELLDIWSRWLGQHRYHQCYPFQSVL